MTKLFKKTLFWTNIAAFTITGLVVAGVAFGWTNPSATPPGGSGAINADSAGNVGIGISASTGYKLNVSGDSRGTRLCIGADCRAAWPSAGLGTTGSPTVNKLTKFTGATTIGNSGIEENASGNVGIGVLAGATYKLDVSGKINGTEICIAGSCKTSWPAAGLTGSGTTGKITKWTGATSLGDSLLSESAGVFSIGTNDLSADSNIWGAVSSTKVDPASVDSVAPWVGNSTAAGGHANWTAQCPAGSFMTGLKQNYYSISGKFGVEVLCAKL